MITKTWLEEYKYIEKCIEETKKKITYYEEHPPRVEFGKTYGSSSEFPYTLRSFTVSGYNGAGADKWQKKINNLYAKLVEQVHELEELKLEIENFINDIPDISTRLIFTYTYIDGMRQENIAKKLKMDQTTISKRITRYLESAKL
jgi:DNA-directed RNA polymerase specialized sigma subunit